MVNSKHITDTDSRLYKSLSIIFQDIYEKQGVDKKIENTVKDSMITTGTMTKYYPYLNKCEVKLDHYDKTVICKNSLLFSGDLLLLYSPSGDESFCEKLREPCIIPRGKLTCFVVNINNDDEEYYMLSYYMKSDLLYNKPPTQGNFKIISNGAVKEYSIEFGLDGLKIVNNGDIEKTIVDDFEDDITMDGYYTKSEVDALIDSLRQELLHNTSNGANDETDNND